MPNGPVEAPKLLGAAEHHAAVLEMRNAKLGGSVKRCPNDDSCLHRTVSGPKNLLGADYLARSSSCKTRSAE